MQKKSTRGFASFSPEKRKMVAAKGGRSAHAQGKAHQFTSQEARKFGALGGRAGRNINIPQ